MTIDAVENIIMLSVAIIGLMTCVFRYIENPRKGWFCASVFFLGHFLSGYYWVIYSVIVHRDPEISAIVANLGCNLGYIFLFLVVINMRPAGSKRFFHPLMLVPLPLNIVQVFLFSPFEGVINNLCQTAFLAVCECLCVNVLLYYLKNRKKGAHFPFTHTAILIFTLMQCEMWTATCFEWTAPSIDPYYYFAFAGYLSMFFLPWAIWKDYELEGLGTPVRSAADLKLHALLRIITAFIILGGCLGGYYIALRLHSAMPAGLEKEGGYGIIAIILFLISLFLALLILALVSVIAIRFKPSDESKKLEDVEGRNRLGVYIVILITLGLMIFSLVYTSRLFYKTSVSGMYTSGKDMTELVAAQMENYLSDARSMLQLTADTVDLMVQNGESRESILELLTFQTQKQFEQIDENCTGIYAYVRGDYMDGSGWVPPPSYYPETRGWFREALDAKGRIVFVSPYVDANTQTSVITICKLISAGEKEGVGKSRNVVALDLLLNRIQEITQQAEIGGKGYGMLIDQSGRIIAHHDPSQVGKILSDIRVREMLGETKGNKRGALDAEVNGEDCTLFVSPVMDQWYFVYVISDDELLENVKAQLSVNIIVSIIIFVFISFFYYLGFKNEQVYGRKVEELRVSRQQQDYEAKVLMLEKTAADEANRAKSHFLADMSHEIRTPINTILGMNEMILREAAGKNIMEYARNIRISGKNLLQLINSILDFSKIEGGKMEIVPVRYSVASLLSYLVNSISERATGKKLMFITEVDPKIPSELFGDDARISQVIMNILTNAVKYTMKGSVTLTVKEKERKDGNVLLYVEVKDTGIGIKEEDMGRLFESFERLDMEKNRHIEGTGLGMAITTKLLDMMGSELKVESVYGKGSVFYFEILQKIENEAPIGEFTPEMPEEDEEGSEEKILYAPDAVILITDDTKMNITVTVNLLKRTGIKIDTAESGPEAINLAGRKAYDVILMDQRMPEMDGTEALKVIRALENGLNSKTPVICLTADAISGARERYIAEGFTDYLTKPVDGASLERMLRKYLPKGKVLKSSIKEIEEKIMEVYGNPLYDVLRSLGVEPKEGLVFCGNDEETYRMVLDEYVADYPEKREKLNRTYSEKNWKDYSVYIHSLKSSSKTIGARGLSELAGALEAASAAGDESILSWDHFRAMKMYDEIVAAIRDKIGTGTTVKSDGDDEEMILEFSPSDQ